MTTTTKSSVTKSLVPASKGFSTAIATSQNDEKLESIICTSTALKSKLSTLLSHLKKRKTKQKSAVSLLPYKAADLASLASVVSLRPLLGNQHYMLRLAVTGALSADGSGNILTSLSLNPSTYQEWTELAELFDEFRVVSGVFHFIPTNRYNRASSDVVRGLMVCFDNDSSTALTSYNDAVEYANVKCHNLSDPFQYHFSRPNITPSAYWTDVATASGSAGAVLLTGAGFTNSLAAGIYYQELFVEFRGRV